MLPCNDWAVEIREGADPIITKKSIMGAAYSVVLVDSYAAWYRAIPFVRNIAVKTRYTMGLFGKCLFPGTSYKHEWYPTRRKGGTGEKVSVPVKRYLRYRE